VEGPGHRGGEIRGHDGRGGAWPPIPVGLTPPPHADSVYGLAFGVATQVFLRVALGVFPRCEWGSELHQAAGVAGEAVPEGGRWPHVSPLCAPERRAGHGRGRPPSRRGLGPFLSRTPRIDAIFQKLVLRGRSALDRFCHRRVIPCVKLNLRRAQPVSNSIRPPVHTFIVTLDRNDGPERARRSFRADAATLDTTTGALLLFEEEEDRWTVASFTDGTWRRFFRADVVPDDEDAGPERQRRPRGE